MSLLEKIKVIEDVLIEMSANQKLFYEELENIKGMLNILVARPFKLVEKEPEPIIRRGSPGFPFAEQKTEPVVIEKVIVKGGNSEEIVEQDFSKVTIMNQTELALLVVKNGYKQWLARQFVKDPLKLGYQNGNIYDIKLKEKSDKGKPIGWITKKWEKFEVFKN